MLRTLVKKQLIEVFRAYFYDAKKNKPRSAAATIGYIIMFVVLMLFLCGLFSALAFLLCAPISALGLDWLFFTIMGTLAIIYGSFGSIFNTYSAVYLAKDNDLLLSMPIPVRVIMASRIIGVYLMGLMYSGSVILPAGIVYLCLVRYTPWAIFCVLWMMLTVSLWVLVISCALGWAVAKVSAKLKNKTFITIAVSLAFFFTYYFFVSKFGDVISSFIANAEQIGESVRGAAYPLYVFGNAGAGDPLSCLAVTAVTAGLLILVLFLMVRSFVGITTASSSSAATKLRVEVTVKRRGMRAALFAKELQRFWSSANYVLNCGMALIMSPIVAALLCMRGEELVGVLAVAMPHINGLAVVILAGTICAVAAMNDMVVPSVSLEGKSLWILQSMPIPAVDVITAKMCVQVLLTSIPVLILSLVGAVVCRLEIAEAVMLVLLPQIFVVFSALVGMVLGLKMPNLNWSSEIVVIKQSLGVMLALLLGVLYASLLIGGYFLFGVYIGSVSYTAVAAGLTLAASGTVYAWIRHRGVQIFRSL